MLERDYQAHLIGRIEQELNGSVVIKNDSNFIQGIPDLTVFYFERYALLEVKVSEKAKPQPNQPYYVEEFNSRSYAAFIYPENEDQILKEMYQVLSDQERLR